MIRVLLVTVVVLLSACGGDHAESWVDEQYANDLSSHGDDANFLIQRGLLANRKHQYIDLLAHASGVPGNLNVELLLASQGSESTKAIAVAQAGTPELQSALEFIGLSPGYSIDVDKLLYWPKGNRVSISVSWASASGGGRFDEVVAAEQLIVDKNWGVALPEQGFRYVGAESGRQTPIEIVSTFNSRDTMFEIAYTVAQQYVMANLVVNPEFEFSAGQALRIRLRPEVRGERVRDYRLDVANGAGDDGGRLSNLKTQLHAVSSETRVSGTFEDIYVSLEKKIAEGEEPFVQIRFSDEMTVESVRDVARFTGQFLVKQQIRIEPADSEPYISAFLPNDAWRDPKRRSRSSQPLEIHMSGGEISGELFQNASESGRREFANANELEELLKTGGPWDTDGVFLFVTPDTPYGQVRNIYALVQKQFRNFYVFP